MPNDASTAAVNDDNHFHTRTADFIRRLTPQLARALDGHAREFLTTHGIGDTTTASAPTTTPTPAPRNTPTPSPPSRRSSTPTKTSKIQWQTHPIPRPLTTIDHHLVCQSKFLTAGQGTHLKDDSLAQDSRSEHR